MGRLYETRNHSCGVQTDRRIYLHDGDALVAEFNASGTVLQRHIHGPAQGTDDPLITYESQYAGLSYARFLQTDARGSIVYSSTHTNTAAVVNAYDEYGQPGSGNVGRFQYTGQVWLPELGMYYYKARIYSPRLGRFMQTDPIGYEDQVNLYGYVGNDPLNLLDPLGTQACEGVSGTCIEADGYDPDLASGTVVADQGVIENAQRNMDQFQVRDLAEYERTNAKTATMNADGAIKPISNVSTSTNQNGGTVTGNIDQNDAIVVIHGHPIKEGTIAPGENDDSAVNSGRASIIVRGKTLGVLEKVNGQFRMRIFGQIVSRDRLNNEVGDRYRIQRQLDKFQARVQQR